MRSTAHIIAIKRHYIPPAAAAWALPFTISKAPAIEYRKKWQDLLSAQQARSVDLTLRGKLLSFDIILLRS